VGHRRLRVGSKGEVEFTHLLGDDKTGSYEGIDQSSAHTTISEWLTYCQG
jgi:hypothetical protein